MGSASSLSIVKLDRELELVDSYDVKQGEDKYYKYPDLRQSKQA